MSYTLFVGRDVYYWSRHLEWVKREAAFFSKHDTFILPEDVRCGTMQTCQMVSGNK